MHPIIVSRILGVALVWMASARLGRGDELPLVTWQGQTMGSTYTVKIVDGSLTSVQTENLKTAVEQRLREVNRQMSHYQFDSDLSRFNLAARQAPFKIPPEFAQVVRFSLELNRLSSGAFDPTLGPVIDLWGFGRNLGQGVVPSESAIREAMRQSGCQHLSITAEDELLKDTPELRLNLSSTAKGFGVDEILRVLLAHALTNVYVAIAGDVRALGHNPRGTNWQVGIATPVTHWREGDPMLAIASIRDRAISTSGDYQKFFTDAQGRRLCHIFDPRTGRPVQHEVGSVSVVAPTSMVASGLATTLFVMGTEAGLKFIDSWTNAAALFIIRDSAGQSRPVPSARFELMTGYRP